ncbi:MAG: hypothetical protein CMJ78_09750 [Planctomycetaceae bacterium]|nr:hypothetical protein [Planctomycetaceae bacterium]
MEGAPPIIPGCCCGLESWREWLEVSSGGKAPWTGHDPSPLIEREEDIIRIWSDGGLGGADACHSIEFTLDQFIDALNCVQSDLKDFLEALEHWLATNDCSDFKYSWNCSTLRFRSAAILKTQSRTLPMLTDSIFTHPA